MKIKCYRKLGDQGRYVCSIRAIKQAFQNFDICVDIGIVNSYSFDFNARNTPHIRGMIVASFLINHREMGTIRKPILRFYPIYERSFSEPDSRKFEKNCIPRLLEWYERISNQSQNQYAGIHEIIIEYYKGDYIAHEFKYM